MHKDAISHPDGIYFGLDEREYHNDPALGSTDVKKLADSPPAYWFDSKHNPLWQPGESTPAQMLGTARHKCILEGEDSFLARYAPTHSSGSTREGKAERAAIADAGMLPMKFDDYASILQSSQIIRSNPSIATAFSGGAGSEVSIFWTDPSARRHKARFDYLKPRATVDLKNTANMYAKDFPSACRDAIARYRYDIQAAHYAEARRAAVGLYEQGLVTGDYDNSIMKACMHNQPVAWVWIFFQSTGAPLTWGAVVSPENPIMTIGREARETALAKYDEYVARFGLDAAWIHDEPLRELAIDEMPAWWARL